MTNLLYRKCSECDVKGQNIKQEETLCEAVSASPASHSPLAEYQLEYPQHSRYR